MDFDYKMTKNEWQMFNHQKKLDKVIEQNRFYCYCGHSVRILPKEQRVFFTHCGHWVYRNELDQLKNIHNIERQFNEEKERNKKENFKNELKRRLKKC